MGGEDHTTARTRSILSGGNGRIRFRGRKTLIRTRVRPTQNVSDPEPQTLKGRHQTCANNNRTPEQEKGRKKGVWKKGIIQKGRVKKEKVGWTGKMPVRGRKNQFI